MRYRPGQSMTFDSDGLQADVMRFMAIIAFCLIAILALVQNVEPPSTSAEIEELPARPATSDMLKPVKEEVEIVVQEPQPVYEEPQPVYEEPQPVYEEPQPAVYREPQPVYEEPPQPVYEEPPQPVYEEPPQAVYEEPPQAVYEEQPQTVYENPPQTVYEEQPQTVYENPPQALALRFATDDAFVALIASEKIQLFARAGNEYYLMGANFGVTLAPATGALYDLLPASVPEKISRIFKRVVTADGYLVALSGDMQNELNRFLREVSDTTQQGGTLVIHRNGHMSYEK